MCSRVPSPGLRVLPCRHPCIRLCLCVADRGDPFVRGGVVFPRGLAVDAAGNVLVLAAQAPQLQKIPASGTGAVALIKEPVFDYANQVAVDAKGGIYVSDGYQKAIWKVSADGKAEKWVQGAPLDNPVGIEFSGENLLIMDSRAKTLFSANPAGQLTKLYPQ